NHRARRERSSLGVGAVVRDAFLSMRGAVAGLPSTALFTCVVARMLRTCCHVTRYVLVNRRSQWFSSHQRRRHVNQTSFQRCAFATRKASKNWRAGTVAPAV